MSNYDKQYEEDLERAQALSLESLALEQFKHKRLQELNQMSQAPLKPKNPSVIRTSSMNETDSAQMKYDRQLSRPRPGSSNNNPVDSLIAPPPSFQRRSNSSSGISNSQDLISFSAPPASTNEIINFSNQQTYSNLIGMNQRMPYEPSTQSSTLSKMIPSMMNQSNQYNPSYREVLNPHLSSNQQYSVSPFVQSTIGQIKNTNLISTDFSITTKSTLKQAPPSLVPINKAKLPSTSTSKNLQSYNNLIDFVQSNDKNSVRVSLLEEFDPLSTSSSFRTISPDFSVEDAVSISDSVYDEYDPYDYIHASSGNNSLSDPVYASVLKTESSPQSPPPPLPPRVHMDSLNGSKYESMKGDWSLLDRLRKNENMSCQIKDPDLKEFYKMVHKLRNEYHWNDANTNIGLVMGPMIKLKCPEGLSVKLSVHPDFEGADFHKPISFTCAVTTSIEHITLQLTCDLEAPNDKYTLKVKGCDEYLAPTTLLSDYEYVHNCIKLEEDIVLILIPDSKKEKVFARTKQDDLRDKDITFTDVIPYELETHITYDSLSILIETLENEMKKLEDAAFQFEHKTNSSEMPFIHPQKVVQSVKYVVNLMGNLYTLDIMDGVEELQKNCTEYHSPNFHGVVKLSCNKIRLAIQNLLEIYSAAFAVDFKIEIPVQQTQNITYVQDVFESVLIKVCSIYRPSVKWKYHSYFVDARICHGSREIKKMIYNDPKYKIEQDMWPDRIVIDSWFQFDDIKINSLARESRLVLVIHGRILDEPENDNDIPKFQEEEIGWASVQFFNFDRQFKNGNMLLSIWPTESNCLHGPAPSSLSGITPMIGVEILAPPNIEFPQELPASSSRICDFNSLDKQTQEVLLDVCDKNMLYKIPLDVREILWDKRHYLYSIPMALPKVLLAARSWAAADLLELHNMLTHWKPLEPIQALELLLPTYPDMEVRKLAVKLICGFQIDELIDYLPQLVVALRFETYDTSSLARMLMEYSLRSPRFAHSLFWLLSHKLPPMNDTDTLQYENSEMRYLRRMKLMWRALLAICGESLRNSFLRQQILVKGLNDAAEVVKQAKDQHKKFLITELEKINEFLIHDPTSLPLSPSLRVSGIKASTSSYFPSNTLPLKINFLMYDGSILPAIYKVGDDLQQDKLTLQMVRLMDKLWLNEGLDLKIVTFNCVPTGYKRGMIEMVTNAETLRKIQTEHGLTGSFKDKPIAEWLGKHNPTELDYDRAVQNFTASCAGYCVATYILGICDRHNDNIMLKTSGHLFHIDFGKFLGDAQMFKNFKRDRVPFVLTSDMAYVINGGDKPTEKFHRFVDLCCQAFNVIRNNANLLICLFTMMASSGITGVTANSVTYLKEALLLKNENEVSNPEAAATFARMIQSSLKSWFTQVNFFLHNIAQLKFNSDTSEGSLLSFVPKVYSMATDERIVQVTVVGCKKRYDPDKYYVYLLRVYRENQIDSMVIQRTYKEFCELHQKICMSFPLAAKLYSLSTGLHMGRSNIKQVAQKRLIEISKFITSLFGCAYEICHSDLVYTFFHPLLRDQQDDNSQRCKDRLNVKHTPGKLYGQLKLSLEFSKHGFTVMIHHVRGLPKLFNGQEPSTYVKVYLKPDENKDTKRKTRVVKKNCHPSFMEMLVYRLSKDKIQDKTLQATVWNYDALQENEFMGGVELNLSNLNLDEEITEWYPLSNVPK